MPIDFIYTKLDSDNTIAASNVSKKLTEIVQNIPPSIYGMSRGEQADGMLVVKDHSSFKLYKITVVDKYAIIAHNDSEVWAAGIDGGQALAYYLLKKKNLLALSWPEACKYLVAILREVSENIDSIGTLEEFGFDIIVFSDVGEIHQCLRYKNESNERVSVGFTLDGSYDITRLFSTIAPQEGLS